MAPYLGYEQGAIILPFYLLKTIHVAGEDKF